MKAPSLLPAGVGSFTRTSTQHGQDTGTCPKPAGSLYPCSHLEQSQQSSCIWRIKPTALGGFNHPGLRAGRAEPLWQWHTGAGSLGQLFQVSQPGQGFGGILPQTGICWGVHTSCRQANPPPIQEGPEQVLGKDGKKGPLLPTHRARAQQRTGAAWKPPAGAVNH